MDSPLNRVRISACSDYIMFKFCSLYKSMLINIYQAHKQERKAEKLISSKKYTEAVACYEIASG